MLKTLDLRQKINKKEALMMQREMTKLDLSLGGIKNMKGIPDAMFIVDVGYENIAIAEARKLNKEIFETIYFAAVTESNAIAEKDGAYESFKGSPASKGELQYDMWGVEPSDRWDWKSLKANIKKHGLRNSVL